MVRAAGLHILSSFHPLKQLVMREGIEPGGAFRSLTARMNRSNSNR
jgi:2-octaprenyl-6-methoxyphenol hydroxylase